jgi:hypothetical protein
VVEQSGHEPGAAIAFFSLAPMLLVAIAVAELALSREAAQGAIGRRGHRRPLSWRAQKCAVSQELGRNLFYKPSMQVYR